MVKRDKVVPGTIIQVVKPTPGQPGPRFQGKLALHERLEVVGEPFSVGGLNLVRVKRLRTNETFDLLYAFVTGFCSLAKAKKATVVPV